MPLPNRVDPWGTIFACPSRGTFMGNRGGQIHNDDRQIVRPYASRRWIACVLEFKGRHRSVMSPGHYTELFFLDEAVALAAGHRPCAECRRSRYNAFREAWMNAGNAYAGTIPIADEMDLAVHRARIDHQRQKVTYLAPLDSLPDGCFIEFDRSSYLVLRDTLLLWSTEGYTTSVARPVSSSVTVLTPEPIVNCLRHGYRPEMKLCLSLR